MFDFQSASLFGMRFVESDAAIEIRTEFKVVSWSTRTKRRRNWRVMKVTTQKPGMFQTGDTIVIHPSLLKQLKAHCDQTSQTQVFQKAY